MNPYRAYQQQTSSHPTRIDMLLALYDATISRLEGGRLALEQQDQATAKALLARAQVLVGGLAAGVDIGQGEIPLNFLRLYEFALYSIRLGTVEGIDAGAARPANFAGSPASDSAGSDQAGTAGPDLRDQRHRHPSSHCLRTARPLPVAKPLHYSAGAWLNFSVPITPSTPLPCSPARRGGSFFRQVRKFFACRL